MKRFRIRRIPRPLHRSHHGLRLPLQLLNKGHQALRLLRIDLLGHQGRGYKSWLEVGVDERPHPGGQNE